MLWSGKPLKIRNYISVICFTSNANIGKKKLIGQKLNMKINKSSRDLKSASDDFNHTLLRVPTKLNRVVFN